MALAINVQSVIRKHELLRKQNTEKLTKEEEKELAAIQKEIDGITQELIALEIKGAEMKRQEIQQPEISLKDKLHMTPSERKFEAERIIRECREKKMKDKAINKQIMAELGVSYAYGYKLLKESEEE